MQIVNLQTVALHVRVDGPEDGVPVVFGNSLGTDLRLWDKVVPLLPSGLRVIRFDKRGHGLSDCPAAPYSMDQLVGDTEALLDQLGVSGCAFVGLSIGGMIAQKLAARRPDLIASLVLSNTAAKMGDASMWKDRISAIQAGGIEALADPIMERWFSAEFLASDELAAWRNMLTRTPREGYIGCCHAIAGTDLSEATSKLTQPTLGIAGSEDGASPPELVEGTIAMIKGASCHTIEGAGHLPCVERPTEYAALLTAFLKELGHV
ncbi:3-oxoadipate enol-lactonase [Actibacterium pelagium]|uniref:3-oxoadipate enol-lactonase n=1 Tax=Actibacterium pelagium TaxID=2029103 RepID=A0A917AP10_9RHOB|nr:3-oxoadipate enol-lactonase [Actibacterium pelagium]GGE62599.1 3-oxoadipate enol-lactonase [Actibacterium pelagium]